MAARINIHSLRKTFPAILDLPSVSTGNNIPKSYHKTRRTWHPNVHRVDQPLRLLETTNKTRQGGSVLKGVKMSMRHLRTLEKSGGVEGTLVSPRFASSVSSSSGSQLNGYNLPLAFSHAKRTHAIRTATPCGSLQAFDSGARCIGCRGGCEVLAGRKQKDQRVMMYPRGLRWACIRPERKHLAAASSASGRAQSFIEPWNACLRLALELDLSMISDTLKDRDCLQGEGDRFVLGISPSCAMWDQLAPGEQLLRL